MISTPPADVTIGGFDGQMLDGHLAPSWTGGCHGPGGPFVGTPILVGASGFTVDIRQYYPLRLNLLDLGDERTMSVAISNVDPSARPNSKSRSLRRCRSSRASSSTLPCHMI
jgi:hypothetical protein